MKGSPERALSGERETLFAKSEFEASQPFRGELPTISASDLPERTLISERAVIRLKAVLEVSPPFRVELPAISLPFLR